MQGQVSANSGSDREQVRADVERLLFRILWLSLGEVDYPWVPEQYREISKDLSHDLCDGVSQDAALILRERLAGRLQEFEIAA